MHGIDITKVIVTSHFTAQQRAKGIRNAQVAEALQNPYKVTPVTRYPGQRRFCGRSVDGMPGVAVIVSPDNRLVTLYLDGTVTALRPDQMHDSAALNSRRIARGA